MAYIELRGLTKRFATGEGEVLALTEVSLDIEQGEFISLVGPSGCGKSTLLRILAGLIPATGGTASVAGRRVTRPRPDVGIVFQSAVLLPWRTVLDNVLLPVDVSRHRSAADRNRANELLELVGLEGFAARYPWQLSGGMQQRVAICRALMMEPALLLMDEPFGALDAITREEMGVELLRIWSGVGATVLFITHSIPEALFLSDRVAVMSSRPGRVVDVVHVPIPRPRSIDVLSTSTLNELASRVRGRIEAGHRMRGGVEASS